MLVDTHVHLDHTRYDDDREAVVERARAAGVGRLLVPATSPDSAEAALALAAAYPGCVFAMAGVHPSSVAEVGPDALARVEALLSRPANAPGGRPVAVGETGLDYYWTRATEAQQHASLRAHARLALEHDLPLVLHSRDRAGSDDCARNLVRLLRESAAEAGGTLRGVFHCFGGPAWLTDDVLGLGFHVGFGGTLTYANSPAAEAAAAVPIERIVLETDGPYLAPVPHRGARNEPAHVALVAERLAAVRGGAAGDVAAATTEAAERLFRLPAQA